MKVDLKAIIAVVTLMFGMGVSYVSTNERITTLEVKQEQLQKLAPVVDGLKIAVVELNATIKALR